ncbi:MAG: class I SAM-dependent DNA methyltransferase [Pseudoxanthomonas sp.]
MAIKKSDLYSTLWASCDELRGGMEPSEYKDYVLFMLFIKYVSDKYAGDEDAPLIIPKGASFTDMVKFKGNGDIGNLINTRVIQPLIDANPSSLARSDFPNFNDPNKLGEGSERRDKLTNLIAIFQNPALDFADNRAEHDDILGDAYEYLMRHFAQDSGKSKGQFYTPAEVSRVLAKLVGISPANAKASTTAYDPTCGSGSLLLKVAAEAGRSISLYGQEISVTTAGLARMNIILHNFPHASVQSGNTLADPKFKDGHNLKTFDYVVANPPFSDKAWSTGVDASNDPYQRFAWGAPPAKQGDYAYLLHIVRSLKSTGKGACILPHGVLFRGNAESDIRRQLVRSGYLKGIVGLPANLFYGTGIPACVLVLDKENAQARKGVFMIDASHDFIKDGPKNRLREQDIHRIVDVFAKAQDVDGFARMVGFKEIEKNGWNLNLPRYIDSSVAEDVQDIAGHLQGGIPQADVDALQEYWDICPKLKTALFKPLRAGYAQLAVDKAAIKSTIYAHPQFSAFLAQMGGHFAAWRDAVAPKLKALPEHFPPKQLGKDLSENLLKHYQGQPLIDAYDVYQHLMDYWAETMQDDAYLISADGWVARPERIVETDKKGRQKDKGWACDLLAKQYIVARYFAAEQKAVDRTAAALEAAGSALDELVEEHSGEDMAFAGFEKVNAAQVKDRIREISPIAKPRRGRLPRHSRAGGNRAASPDPAEAAELAVLEKWLALSDKEATLKKKLRVLESELDAKAYAKYPQLSVDEIKSLVVDDKWLAALSAAVHGEVQRVSQSLTARVRELALRYEKPLPLLVDEVAALSAKVKGHLAKMGAAWS